MNFYRRKLPHWQPNGAQYFLTFRLAGSLPRKVIEELRVLQKQFQSTNDPNDILCQTIYQREVFRRYDLALDSRNSGPTWLTNPAVAKVVQEAIHYRDACEYDLFAYCIMSNHVHIVIEHLDKNPTDASTKEYTVTKILQELKRYTAQKCNKVLGRKGAFWQSESYDRVIQDSEELENTTAYTLNNPVKAGLAKHWKDWPYTYCKPEYIECFG